MKRTQQTLPNLLLLGQQKAGTTWLFHEIVKHPAVAGSDPKELFHFNKSPEHVDRNADTYRQRFHLEDGIRHYCEATATYFWVREEGAPFDDATVLPTQSWHTIDNIRRCLGDDLRFVVLFRHPVARALSAFYHNYRRRRIEPHESLLTAGKRFGILDMSFIARQCQQWLDTFPREKFLFLNYDDIAARPETVIRQTVEFLSEDPSLLPPLDTGRKNVGFPLSVNDGRIVIDSSSKRNEMSAGTRDLTSRGDSPYVTAEEVEFLSELYEPSIGYLEALTGWDLSSWKTSRLENVVRL